MGNRDEVCVTYDPGAQSAETFADRLREYLDGGAAGPPLDPPHPDSTDLDDVVVAVGDEVDAPAAVDEYVYAYGVTWSYAEQEGWRSVLRAFPEECAWYLDVHTQEAGYMGEGHLYWRIDGEYVKVDEYHTAEGGYDDELVDYFVVEHDHWPLTFSRMHLD